MPEGNAPSVDCRPYAAHYFGNTVCVVCTVLYVCVGLMQPNVYQLRTLWKLHVQHFNALICDAWNILDHMPLTHSIIYLFRFLCMVFARSSCRTRTRAKRLYFMITPCAYSRLCSVYCHRSCSFVCRNVSLPGAA